MVQARRLLDECGVCGVCDGPGIPEGACDCAGTLPACGYDCDGVCILDEDNDGICDCEDECVPAEASAEDNFDYKLIVEEYHVGALGTTYRFYVNAMDPTDKISAVFGNDQNPLVINTPDGIYNDAFNTSLECVWHQLCSFRVLPRFGLRQLRHNRS